MSQRRLRRWATRLRKSGYLLPAGLTGWLALKGLQPHLPGWPCPLRALTGIPCPGCFLSRATAAALTGQLQESVRLHAFGPPLAVALLVWTAVSLRQRTLQPPLPPRLLAAAAAALLLYWLLRLGLWFGLGLRGFPAFPLEAGS
ncbi:MAG: DUF2752 domain-containing protein [Synechococcaceae cyanobacterium]